MERMWLGDARLKYPNMWIVAINISWGDKNKAYGDIYLVTPSKGEAYAIAIELNDKGEMGNVTVTEGVNDIRFVGGLEVCCQ